MWNNVEKINKNCNNLKRITYQCSDEDLGRREVSIRNKQKKAYTKIFEKQALSNMKERLKTFNQFQSQLKQQNHEEAKKSD